MSRLFLCVIAAFACFSSAARAQPRQAELDALLSADRAFSAAAARAPSAADGFAPMFDADVVMPSGGQHVSGRDAVVAAFRDSPAFREGRVSWTPVRGGVSADGSQGFTYGYLSLSGGDPARRDRKYLAYWVHRPEGWRVAAYRQLPRAAGEVSLAMLPPSLPAGAAEPSEDRALIERHERSLAAAEQAFSDYAQRVGLRTAFRENGREDAMNMYEGAAFRVGLDAVTQGFPEGVTTSPVNWSTDRAIAASSGDLGVSIGMIRANGPVPEGQPGSFPFFTIWRRDAPDQPWRYIAE
jgi:ketosteroid isomerase-like protein